jgi:hypothetical protein
VQANNGELCYRIDILSGLISLAAPHGTFFAKSIRSKDEFL